MLKISSFVKSTTATLSAELITRIVSLLLGLLLAKYISVSDLGFFALALSLANIFLIAPQGGFDQRLQNELSRNHEKAFTFTAPLFYWKIIFSFISIFIGFLFWQLSPGTQNAKEIFILVFLFQTTTSFYYTSQAFLRSKQLFIQDSLLRLFYNLIFLLGGFFVIRYFKSLPYYLIFIAILSLLFFFIQMNFAKTHLALSLVPFHQLKFWLKDTWPYLITTIIAMVYINSDSFVLNLLAGNQATGYLRVAMQIGQSLIMFPSALFAIALNKLSLSYETDMNTYVIKLNKMVSIMLPFIFLPSFFLVIFSKEILIQLFNDKFLSSISLLEGLSVAAIPFAVASTVGIEIIHGKKFIPMAKVLMLLIIINFGFNFIFIPRIGLNGIVFSRIITDFFLLVFYIIIIKHTSPKVLKTSHLLHILFAVVSSFILFVFSIEKLSFLARIPIFAVFCIYIIFISYNSLKLHFNNYKFKGKIV